MPKVAGSNKLIIVVSCGVPYGRCAILFVQLIAALDELGKMHQRESKFRTVEATILRSVGKQQGPSLF